MWIGVKRVDVEESYMPTLPSSFAVKGDDENITFELIGMANEHTRPSVVGPGEKGGHYSAQPNKGSMKNQRMEIVLIPVGQGSEVL